METFISGKTYLSVAKQNIDKEDKSLLHSVVENEQYAEGKHAAFFRSELAQYFGVNGAFLTNSGSSALLAALTVARELHKGKYVITSALGFPTTVAAIYQAGFIPWYMDCDPFTLHVPCELIIDALQENDVVGVVLAHTLGFPFNEYYLNNAIKNIREDAFLISDACDAAGAEIWYQDQWKKVGGGADMATLSLYPAHQISAGEGGVVLCNNSKYSSILHSVINWGRDCFCEPGQDNCCGKRFGHSFDGLPEVYDHKYIYTRLGYNLKMTEFSAALGRSQLKKLDAFVEQRRQNYRFIREALDLFPWLSVLPKYPSVRSSPFGVPVEFIIEPSCDRLTSYLEDHKIGTRRLFGGNLLRQPAFRDLESRHSKWNIGADELMEKAFWIGCWPGWTQAMTDYVCEILQRYETEFL